MKEIEKYFSKVNIKRIKETISDEYYLLKDEHNSLFVKSEFFVMAIFSHGSKWAENLFSDLYNNPPSYNEIINDIRNFEGLSIDVEINGDVFKNAILIPENKPVNKNEESKLSSVEDKISLKNVVIRVLKKKVPLDFIESVGSGSQFLLSENEKIEVELIQNNKIIGKGILEKIDDGYSLEITEVQI
ncbi:hypothetical protein [Hydrogenivirga sp. 128-5-R1-1]|uniref:hypothetical protein n=1 Tax=Hydrogenivirga sp. 128-5-R1-1 TaxID=392423 RepID=UPI00015F2F80|nr:hypothetical protein [Hydrogenivirga sp. 128-5-R1-1]EDP73975.1 hypothetical protein HG1285_08046 [Hydrogenivirga sp. 128-5-R1-1]